jgi:hypothetical protein
MQGERVQYDDDDAIMIVETLYVDYESPLVLSAIIRGDLLFLCGRLDLRITDT